MKCRDCIHHDLCFDMGFVLDPIHGGMPCNSFRAKGDFVKVVRCKDCKYYVPAANGVGDCEREEVLYLNVSETSFCSYGEREEK